MDEKWLKRVIEIQSLAQCGLAYCKDDYDLERYRRLREIAAEMMSDASGLPVEKVQDLFCNESGYQTPKLDTRAAVFREGTPTLPYIHLPSTILARQRLR